MRIVGWEFDQLFSIFDTPTPFSTFKRLTGSIDYWYTDKGKDTDAGTIAVGLSQKGEIKVEGSVVDYLENIKYILIEFIVVFSFYKVALLTQNFMLDDNV